MECRVIKSSLYQWLIYDDIAVPYVCYVNGGAAYGGTPGVRHYVNGTGLTRTEPHPHIPSIKNPPIELCHKTNPLFIVAGVSFIY